MKTYLFSVNYHFIAVILLSFHIVVKLVKMWSLMSNYPWIVSMSETLKSANPIKCVNVMKIKFMVHVKE